MPSSSERPLANWCGKKTDPGDGKEAIVKNFSFDKGFIEVENNIKKKN